MIDQSLGQLDGMFYMWCSVSFAKKQPSHSIKKRALVWELHYFELNGIVKQDQICLMDSVVDATHFQ